MAMLHPGRSSVVSGIYGGGWLEARSLFMWGLVGGWMDGWVCMYVYMLCVV